MKFNFKKIVPIAIGAVLLGSTIGFAGALAADVTYPNDFADAVVVIGAAGAADTVAANMIANDLGKLTTGVQTAVSEGWLAKKGSTSLYYKGDIESIDAELDSSDLSLLTDTTYKDNKGTNKADYDTEETITFTDAADVVAFETSQKGDTKDIRGPYLKLFKDVATLPALTYKIEFPTGVAYDNSTAALLDADFELTKVKMLGKEWTIINAEGASILADGPNKLTLLGGAEAATMNSGETQVFVVGGKSYSVEVVVRDTDVTFNVDGESLTLDEGEIDELSDGTQIGVTKISTATKESVPNTVGFYIGANKLVLENGQKVSLDDNDVDGTLVAITVDKTNKELSDIQVKISPDENTWIASGKEWKDTVFGAVKLVFAGIDQGTTEQITFSGGSDGSIAFKNKKGTAMELSLVDNGTAVFLGDDDMSTANITSLSKTSYPGQGGNMLVADGDACTGLDLEDCEGVQLLVVDADGEARIIEISDVDLSNMKIKFKDLTEGGDAKEVNLYDNASHSYDVGYTTITMAVNTSANLTLGNGAPLYGILNVTALNLQTDNRMLTSLEGQLSLASATNNVQVNLYNSTADGKLLLGMFNATYDTTDEEIQAVNVLAGQMDDEASNTDWQTGIDSAGYGALFRYDSDAKKDLTITYPEERVVANVYIAPVSAVVSGGGIVPVMSASNLGDYKTTKDLVVVGGSAVNAVAAELLKVAYPTYGIDAAWTTATGVSPDMAIIKLFSGADKSFGTGKVALLVAGYEAKDTQAAAKALIAEKKFGLLSTTTASAYTYK